MTDIAIRYDENALIGAVGPSVWAKLGPEDWFTNYKIVVANAREYDRPFVVDLGLGVDDLEKATTGEIVATPQFITIANKELPGYRFIAYKSIDIPGGMERERFITNDSQFVRFEDKKFFRQTFTGRLPIPEHEIVPYHHLAARTPHELFDVYTARFDSPLVMQDSLDSGGRGTHIIRTVDDMTRAMEILSRERKSEEMIISRFINGKERSIQVCVAKDGVHKGPLQQQLTRNPELLNPLGRGGMFFCGGKFLAYESKAVEDQIAAAVDIVAEELRQSGYKGIFGVDFLLDDSEKIWTIEINARTTGLLPLLNEQDSRVPLYLLHVLELAQIDYEIELSELDRELAATGPQSFVVLFNQRDERAYFDQTIKTGNYVWRNNELVLMNEEARWSKNADCMLQLFASNSYAATPNVKLCNVFLRGEGFNDDGELDARSRDIVAYLKKHVVAV